MTPEQRAKIQALRNGERYELPEEPKRVREIPLAIKQLKQQVNFKRLFKEIAK